MPSPFEPCVKCKAAYLIDCNCPSSLLEAAKAIVKAYVDHFGIVSPAEIKELQIAIEKEEK